MKIQRYKLDASDAECGWCEASGGFDPLTAELVPDDHFGELVKWDDVRELVEAYERNRELAAHSRDGEA